MSDSLNAEIDRLQEIATAAGDAETRLRTELTAAIQVKQSAHDAVKLLENAVRELEWIDQRRGKIGV